MTKEKAIRLFVSREVQTVPQDWAMAIAEKEGEFHRLGMWGTVFLVDDCVGEKLVTAAQSTYENEAEAIENGVDETKADDYVDEEMAGELRICDKKRSPTAAYIHIIAGQYVISVNGAGWDFYDGVWNVIYDLLGLKWHSEEDHCDDLKLTSNGNGQRP